MRNDDDKRETENTFWRDTWCSHCDEYDVTSRDDEQVPVYFSNIYLQLLPNHTALYPRRL